VRHARNVQGLSRYYSEAERYNAERIERQQPKDVLGEIAKQKWTGHYPEQEVSVGLRRLRLRGLLSARQAMLRGKEIPYHLDGPDNLLEALHGEQQGTWYDRETQQFVTGKPQPKPSEQNFHSYAEFAAYFWK
jgi:hypothetical protein